MKKSKDSRYIEILNQEPYAEIPSDASAEELLEAYRIQVEGGDKADISYSLENIVADLEEPRVLLVDFGDHAVNTVHAVKDAGIEVHVPYTTDMQKSPYIRVAQGGVCIGECFSEFIFKNSYAILKAAQECQAQAILFIDPALCADESFLGLAAQRGLKVFRAISANVPQMGWIICETNKLSVADDVWKKCRKCNLLFDEQSLALNHYMCPACGEYYRISSLERINDLLDAQSFEEWCQGFSDSDPLHFPGYQEKVASIRENTGLEEAVRCGTGSIAGIRIALCVMDSAFMMGSMGHVVGEKITRTVERAMQENLPLVIFSASGGARMQEGLISLMQMAKISTAISRHSDQELPFISVITDPTTGGVTASFAMQGDIIFAEPGSLIGFAGQRVIRDTIKRELPEGFQTAEFALEHGLIDAIVERKDMRKQLAHALASCLAHTEHNQFVNGDTISHTRLEENLRHGYFTTNLVHYGMSPQIKKVILSNLKESKSPLHEVFKIPAFFKRPEKQKKQSHDAMLIDQEDADQLLGENTPHDREVSEENAGWKSIQIMRNTKRPTAHYYINEVFDYFLELHGDRAFSDDGAIIGGIAWMDDKPVTVVGLEKGVDLKDRLARNFGCPQPEGYRKSLRLMKQAEKFKRPIVCFVDTQGAYCGTEAEERGQGNAIADNLKVLASLEVPVISIMIGEGGSGGALALALADRIAMQQYAVYSVLSPEGFASILWKDGSKAAEAAAVMKMTATEVHEMGIVDAVLSEGPCPAHENPKEAAASIQSYLQKTLKELSLLSLDELSAQRYERFRKF